MQENSPVALPANSLLLNVNKQKGHPWLAVSEDNGAFIQVCLEHAAGIHAATEWCSEQYSSEHKFCHPPHTLSTEKAPCLAGKEHKDALVAANMVQHPGQPSCHAVGHGEGMGRGNMR